MFLTYGRTETKLVTTNDKNDDNMSIDSDNSNGNKSTTKSKNKSKSKTSKKTRSKSTSAKKNNGKTQSRARSSDIFVNYFASPPPPRKNVKLCNYFHLFV